MLSIVVMLVLPRLGSLIRSRHFRVKQQIDDEYDGDDRERNIGHPQAWGRGIEKPRVAEDPS